MRALKLAIIGAGSTYTPELIEGLIDKREQLPIQSIYLMDIDDRKLSIVGGLAQRMLEAGNMPTEVVLTDDLDEAVRGADYVMGQVRVGKLDARILDEKIPLKHGLLGQETTGAGGFMNGLRTIPVIMDVAETMERLAPDAWLINFSNPAGMVAEAVLNHSSIKMMGLCNIAVNMLKSVQESLPEGAAFDYDFLGLNHLCWITRIETDGKDILNELIEGDLKLSRMRNLSDPLYDKDLLKATKGIPAGYLNYFYFREREVERCLAKPKTRGEECKVIEEDLLQLYSDPSLKEKPSLLEKRGGALYSTAAISLIDAIENDRNEYHVVNVKNQGALDFMDFDDVVEVKCMVGKDGAKPVPVRNFNNDFIIGLMKAVKAYEKLAVKAALNGDYHAALAALLVHPLIGDYHKAKAVLDEMLEANEEFVPRFS
ncbi:MAG: 6-phospho-beta-glucosidase [Firmicutes bacterium]|nr:6-phospho-beta-glucosidase [Bacillota bacterium]